MEEHWIFYFRIKPQPSIISTQVKVPCSKHKSDENCKISHCMVKSHRYEHSISLKSIDRIHHFWHLNIYSYKVKIEGVNNCTGLEICTLKLLLIHPDYSPRLLYLYVNSWEPINPQKISKTPKNPRKIRKSEISKLSSLSVKFSALTWQCGPLITRSTELEAYL